MYSIIINSTITNELMSSALVKAEDWPLSRILSRTSLKEQVQLLWAQSELSRVQVHLDAEDEALVQDAQLLYQSERPARKRREAIIEQQEAILAELQRLIEDKGAFAGHTTFSNGSGFAEGLTY